MHHADDIEQTTLSSVNTEAAAMIATGEYPSAIQYLRNALHQLSSSLDDAANIVDRNQDNMSFDIQPTRIPDGFGNTKDAIEDPIFTLPFIVLPVRLHCPISAVTVVALFNMALASQLESYRPCDCGKEYRLLCQARALYTQAYFLLKELNFGGVSSMLLAAVCNNLTEIEYNIGDLQAANVWKAQAASSIARIYQQQDLHPDAWRHFLFVEVLYGSSHIRAARAA